jgi:hypothetical protein
MLTYNILIFSISPSLGLENTNISNENDIEVEIYAGIYEKTDGDIGLGWIVAIKNNLNNSIKGNINTTWFRLNNNVLRNENLEFNLSANHPKIKFQYVDYLHFPSPILKLGISVEINDIFISKSGIEIGPFVIFK